jgi:acyl carrier protein
MDQGIEAIANYLQNRHPELGRLDPGQELIDSRILDSLAFLEFILLLEELTGTEIGVDSVAREDFRTLRAIERRFFPAAAERAETG